MAAQGLESLFPIRSLALMGLFEVLPKIFELRTLLKRTVADIQVRTPDVLVTIDSPGFTLRVLKALQPTTLKRAHYVAPQVWAWRENRVKHYPGLWDELLCLLPFEPAFFARHGLPARFVAIPCWKAVPTPVTPNGSATAMRFHPAQKSSRLCQAAAKPRFPAFCRSWKPRSGCYRTGHPGRTAGRPGRGGRPPAHRILAHPADPGGRHRGQVRRFRGLRRRVDEVRHLDVGVGAGERADAGDVSDQSPLAPDR